MNEKSLFLVPMLLCSGLPPAEGQPVDSLGDPLPRSAVQRLGTLRMRYRRFPCLAYLPGNRAIVTQGGYVDICDVTRGTRLSRTKVTDAGITCVQLRPGGDVLLIGDSDGSIREWDVRTQTETRAWKTAIRPLASACYSPDATRVLVAGGTPPVMAEWELSSARKLVEMQSQMATTRNGAIYGPNGTSAILGGGYEHNLEHYDLATGKLLKKWCTIYQAKRLALSPDQRSITVGVEDRAVEWSLDDYTVVRHYKRCPGEAARVYALAYVPDSNELLCGGRDGGIYRWSRETGTVLSSWTPHQSTVEPLCVSPDQVWVLSWGTGLVAETNIATGKPRITFDRHAGSVEGAAFLPSGNRVVSASSDTTLRVWNVTTGATIRVIEGAALGAYALAISPDGSRVAAGCKDGNVREFSIPEGTLIRKLSGHRGYVRAVAYTPDGEQLLSSADDGSIRVWVTGHPEAQSVLQGHKGGVLDVAVSPDGTSALSGGRDGTVRLWDLTAAKLARTCQGHRGWVNCVTFSPDGDSALSGGRNGRVLRWNVRTGVATWNVQSGTEIHALACSSDGKTAWAAGASAKIIRFDFATGEWQAGFEGHGAAVLDVDISADGSRLVSASRDTALLVWDVAGD